MFLKKDAALRTFVINLGTKRHTPGPYLRKLKHDHGVGKAMCVAGVHTYVRAWLIVPIRGSVDECGDKGVRTNWCLGNAVLQMIGVGTRMDVRG